MKSSWKLRSLSRPTILAIVAIYSLPLFLPTASVSDEHSSQPLVMDLNLDGEVEPVLAAYIDEGLAEAARRSAALVLITMDTPGGLSDSMKDIARGGVCGTNGGTWRFGRIFHFDERGCGGDGAGNEDRCGFARNCDRWIHDRRG
jgi:hypothetical protein